MGMKVGHSLMAFSMFITSFIVGYYSCWKLALVMTSIVPFFIFGGWLINIYVTNRDVNQKENYERAGGFAEEVINKIKTVASFANYQYEIKRFNDNIDQVNSSNIKSGLKISIFLGFYFFIIFGGFALAVWYGSVLIANKEPNIHTNEAIGIGEFLVVIFTIIFGSLAIGQASPNIKAISKACVAATDFFKLKKRNPNIDLTKSHDKPDKATIIGKISFNNVNFAYQSNPKKTIIKNLNLTFEPKKKIAIVGESGSGKSTISYLIERLYDASSGSILLDNIDIRNLDLQYYRSLIGYTPQESILFNTTIRENIKFGRDNITEEDIVRACKLAYADEFINKIEQGFDYIVGTKGSKLSGGQKQRIAIARAIVAKPKILILDEPTSALDFKSEKQVQHALDEISKEMTTIIIANRLSTIQNADLILVLSAGEMVELGNHEELLKKNGLYAALIKSELNNLNKEVNILEHKLTSPTTEVDHILTTHYINNIKIHEEDKFNEIRDENQIERNHHTLNKSKSDKKKIVRSKVWDLMKENVKIPIFSAFFALCSGAIWPIYGILLAISVDVLITPKSAKEHGSPMAGWFVLVAALNGACICMQQ